jgi:hypothetical protein
LAAFLKHLFFDFLFLEKTLVGFLINIPENIKQFGDEAVPIVKVEDCNRSNALQDETSQFLGIKILPLQLCGTTKEIAGEHDLKKLW